jgi:hypothetical protein
MSYRDYRNNQVNIQLAWRANQKEISTEYGYQNGFKYSHIVPKEEWSKTVCYLFRDELVDYLEKEDIQHHTGSHNLLSSWILCSNIYFGIFVNKNLKEMFRLFLEDKLSIKIEEIIEIHLEYVLTDILSPRILLGEPGGKRGTKQTTPDLAVLISNNGKQELILVECKYTEQSFYDCPVRKNNDLKINCVNKEEVKTLKNNCPQIQWGRKYWD